MRIPCVLMRGGTSRGAFFLASDLPRNIQDRDEVLLSALGAGHELQVDGIGGGHPLTSKVAIVSASARADADIDYLFAQINVLEHLVDTSPNCGNMLSAVGPFAIEKGLVKAKNDVTTLRVHNINTGKLIDISVQTPNGVVTYEGETRIDGVPGTASAIYMTFLDAAGAKTGKLLPTGHARDLILGVEASCIDAAMPLVILRAADVGKTGQETPEALDADLAFKARLETIRLAAGRLMGLGDVSGLVIPKPVLIAPGRSQASLCTRYFMPHACHKAIAITGAVGIATACAIPGTLAAELFSRSLIPGDIVAEHPSGSLTLHLEAGGDGAAPLVSVVRTARRIFEGVVDVRIPQPMQGNRAA